MSLPIVGVLAFLMAWNRYHDLPAASRVARKTSILVPLGLPFFVPLAFADRLDFGFWTAAAAGIVLATIEIVGHMVLAPR